MAASSPVKKKIKVTFKQLKRLSSSAAPGSKVLRLLSKLAKLDPKHVARYYKIGLKKISPFQATQFAAKINRKIIGIVKHSDLSNSKIGSLIRQLDKVENRFIPPPIEPTPTPYQALRLPGSALLAV